MLCELLAELFGRDRHRPPLRTLTTRAADPPEREPEPQDLGAGWCGPAAPPGTVEHSGVTEFLGW
jgi:hypothetical protein